MPAGKLLCRVPFPSPGSRTLPVPPVCGAWQELEVAGVNLSHRASLGHKKKVFKLSACGPWSRCFGAIRITESENIPS